MFVVNASNIKKDFDWISSHTAGLQVELLDKSDDVSLLALQGPKSLDTLRKLTAVNLADMAYYTFAEANVGGVEMIVSRTGYTGELGFELYFDSSPVHAERAWNMLMEAGREFGITPAGLGARDSLRLEMGYCLYGNDIDQTTHPLEAGLSWITKLDKGDFVGRASLLEKQREGLRRKLVGFTTEDPRAIPRHGYEIHCGNASPGVVTSGTVSPTLERGIGMGYVPAGSAGAGSALEVLIRGRECMATVVKLPFIRK